MLIGPPGAGKTSVGTALAKRWGVGFRDSDADVEELLGMPISDVFVQLGEQAFREHERVAVEAALAEHDGVLALGGGAVMTPAVAERLAAARVVFLDVSLADAGSRVGLNVARPLLLGNVRGQLKSLMEVRRPTYERVSRVVVDTSGRSIDDVVAAVEAGRRDARRQSVTSRDRSPVTDLVAPVTVRVEGPSPYDVLIGDGVLKALATLVGSSADNAVVRAAVVHPAGVSHIAHRCADALSAAGSAVSLVRVPDAEEAKTAGWP